MKKPSSSPSGASAAHGHSPLRHDNDNDDPDAVSFDGIGIGTADAGHNLPYSASSTTTGSNSHATNGVSSSRPVGIGDEPPEDAADGSRMKKTRAEHYPHPHMSATTAEALQHAAPAAPVGLGGRNADNDNKEAAGQPGGGKKGASIRTFPKEFGKALWKIITSSWLNVMLVFVPVGIVVAQISSLHGPVTFAMNCLAIIPLAGLLSYATESVARKMGDAVGALMNITFGNAVELIIFIIALTKNEIRIVQASLLGSILANLLLILGMSFLCGGLRYREQIYNSTVTQMSACLLSLSVISLVLPTAFHASFADQELADQKSLTISRGTSIVLLLVYILYLLFQLNSHAYMYESTPQHIVDAESTPGPVANWLDSSSSSDGSSDGSDSDGSDTSRETVRERVKKVLRARRRRKSSVTSSDSHGTNPQASRPDGFFAGAPTSEEVAYEPSSSRPHVLQPRQPGPGGEEAVEDETSGPSGRHGKSSGRRKHKKRHHKKHRTDKTWGRGVDRRVADAEEDVDPPVLVAGEPRRVDFAVSRAGDGPGAEAAATNRRGGFPMLNAMSVKNLAPSIFVQRPEPGSAAPAPARPVPHIRYGIRRTNSLPDRLNPLNHQIRPPGALFPSQLPAGALADTDAREGGAEDGAPKKEGDDALSTPMAVVLLLLTTALVAVCAEFLVDSIREVTASGTVPEMFIGLILLPVVGNAAEHVTAVVCASRNKMDLAIGVAVGSSIQIALFITPVVVLLGWILDRDMSLYFTLFETVCLFVSSFIVNFLVLDGRSNYLEGALLCATYVIIAVIAFYSPSGDDASAWGG